MYWDPHWVRTTALNWEQHSDEQTGMHWDPHWARTTALNWDHCSDEQTGMQWDLQMDTCSGSHLEMLMDRHWARPTETAKD